MQKGDFQHVPLPLNLQYYWCHFMTGDCCMTVHCDSSCGARSTTGKPLDNILSRLCPDKQKMSVEALDFQFSLVFGPQIVKSFTDGAFRYDHRICVNLNFMVDTSCSHTILSLKKIPM